MAKNSWDSYWKENKNKETFFNGLVAVLRKYYFAKAFAKFLNQHHPVKGKKVCEIGVGSGLTLAHIKNLGASSCVGVDNSNEAIELAKQENKTCEFVFGDAFKLPFADKEFDIVYSLGLIEHFNRDQQRQILAEQKRIAKECVFIEVPYDVFYFRWLFAFNRSRGRTLTFSDEELFTKATFRDIGLKGESKLMPTTFFLTIGHFEPSNT